MNAYVMLYLELWYNMNPNSILGHSHEVHSDSKIIPIFFLNFSSTAILLTCFYEGRIKSIKGSTKLCIFNS